MRLSGLLRGAHRKEEDAGSVDLRPRRRREDHSFVLRAGRATLIWRSGRKHGVDELHTAPTAGINLLSLR